jgi:hypothetical protein
MTIRNRSFLLVIVPVLAVVGCARPTPPGDPSPTEQGARVWAATCTRCHNLRAPSQFTAEQWPVIVNHMRTRANLTRSEAEAVTAYLQRVASGDSRMGPPAGPGG